MCYLIISHGMQVDEASNVFKHLENEYSVPYKYMPSNYFCNESKEQKIKLLVFLGEMNMKYGIPAHGSFSGFWMHEKGMVRAFTCYQEHLGEMISGLTEEKKRQKTPPCIDRSNNYIWKGNHGDP